MVDILGTDIPVDVPSINVTGFMSGSWIWVALVLFLGIILMVGVAFILFLRTWNRRVELFEDIGGNGRYQRLVITRARILKVGDKGEEILKTMKGKLFLTAYGKKMGRKNYWFARGPDGYWYNFVLGDLDTKMGILDIEPVDRDVRMMHVALDRLSQDKYGQKSKMPMILLGTGIFIVLVILLVGMYVVAGRFVEAAQSMASTANANTEVLKSLNGVLRASGNIQSTTGGSGVVPTT